MNCAFVASYYGPYYSNFVASMFAFDQEMHQRGHAVVYVFPKEAEQFTWRQKLDELGRKAYFIPYKPNSWHNLQALRAIFRENQIQLIYSHMCGWDLTARLAALTTPVVWHMRMGVNNTPWLKHLVHWIRYRILGFGRTYHIGCSQAVADAINSLHPKHPCVGIHNCLDFSRLEKDFRPFPAKPPYTLLVFGWSPATKGLDLVLDACAEINHSDMILQLLVSSQEKTYQYINQRYSDQFPPWLKLIPPTDKVNELYRQADIMISASRSEGFSFSLAEAIYSGLPAIYSDIPGTSWAGDFCATHVFKSGDAIDLARAIHQCIEHGISLEEQQMNRRQMEECYSMETWKKKIVDYLETIQG